MFSYFEKLYQFIFVGNTSLTFTLKVIIIFCLLILSWVFAQKIHTSISISLRSGASERKKAIKGTYADKVYLKKTKGTDGKLSKWLRKHNVRMPVYQILLIKFLLAFVLGIFPLLTATKNQIPLTVVFTLTGFFIIEIVFIIDYMITKSSMEKDMPNIVNNLYMQTEVKVHFKDCLETLHQSAIHSKLLKEALKDLYIRFVSHEHDIVAACDEIEELYPESVSFSVLLTAFRQYTNSGKMKAILERQNELYMKKEEEMIERGNSTIIKTAAISTVLIAINCIIMLVYPMWVEMNDRMILLFGK